MVRCNSMHMTVCMPCMLHAAYAVYSACYSAVAWLVCGCVHVCARSALCACVLYAAGGTGFRWWYLRWWRFEIFMLGTHRPKLDPDLERMATIPVSRWIPRCCRCTPFLTFSTRTGHHVVFCRRLADHALSSIVLSNATLRLSLVLRLSLALSPSPSLSLSPSPSPSLSSCSVLRLVGSLGSAALTWLLDLLEDSPVCTAHTYSMASSLLEPDGFSPVLL